MRLIIQSDYLNLSKWIANYVGEKILYAHPTLDSPFVLGLPTGSSPLGMYGYLVDLYQKKKISFRHVITFNMDEYIGLPENHPESYHSFMWNHFFEKIDIIPENVYILDGNSSNLSVECTLFEEKITKVGGIDLFLGGIGENGHMAFNEPGSLIDSCTHIVTLTQNTLHANARFFNNDINYVPKQALTVGIKTILDAKEVLFMANGNCKASILAQAIEGPISSNYPISFLKLHPKSIIVCDESAASSLEANIYHYFKEIEQKELL